MYSAAQMHTGVKTKQYRRLSDIFYDFPIFTLHKKCPYLEFFWFVFFGFRTEYGNLRIQSKCRKMRNRKPLNTDTFYAVLLVSTAWKMSVFRVFLAHIFPHSDWIWTRKTQNAGTFDLVFILHFCDHSCCDIFLTYVSSTFNKF